MKQQIVCALAGFIALCVSSAVSSKVSNADSRPPAPVQQGPILPDFADQASEVIKLREDRHRRYTVPVMIDGSGPFDFVIDTGSEATAVSHEINIGLALPHLGSATLVAMASRRPVALVEVGSLRVGSHTVEQLRAPLLYRGNIGADGIIGLDSLQDLRVLIDFREETIAVDHGNGEADTRRGFEIVVRARPRLGQLLITDAKVDGVRATVIIDTGAQMSLGNTALRERLRARRLAQIVATDVNGVDLVGKVSMVRELLIEGLALSNVPLAFADTPAFEALGLEDTPAISLGMQHLAIFERVAIDFANRRVLFDLPRDVANALRRARTRSGSRYRY